jgi:hypothetical protein
MNIFDARNGILFSVGPKWPPALPQTLSFHYPTSRRGKDIFGTAETNWKDMKKESFYALACIFCFNPSWPYSMTNILGSTTSIDFALSIDIVSTIVTLVQ